MSKVVRVHTLQAAVVHCISSMAVSAAATEPGVMELAVATAAMSVLTVSTHVTVTRHAQAKVYVTAKAHATVSITMSVITASTPATEIHPVVVMAIAQPVGPAFVTLVSMAMTAQQNAAIMENV